MASQFSDSLFNNVYNINSLSLIRKLGHDSYSQLEETTDFLADIVEKVDEINHQLGTYYVNTLHTGSSR